MTKHILYLASGKSRRFGENKLFHSLDGKPLYLHGLEMLAECVKLHGDCTLTVVSCYEEIRQQALFRGIKAVDSPESHKGISYTIKAGLAALEQLSDAERNLKREKSKEGSCVSEKDFVMFMVADQPYLRLVSVEKLLACAAEGTETASLQFGERPGNPTLFSAKLIPELLALEGDCGGRAVIRKHSCIFVQAESEKELRDIDTKENLWDCRGV